MKLNNKKHVSSSQEEMFNWNFELRLKTNFVDNLPNRLEVSFA